MLRAPPVLRAAATGAPVLGRAAGVGVVLVGAIDRGVAVGGGVTRTRAVAGAGATDAIGATGIGFGAGVTRTSAVSRAGSTVHNAEIAADSAASVRGSTVVAVGVGADRTGDRAGRAARSLTVGVVLIGADAIGALACDSTDGDGAGDFTLRTARLRGLSDSFAGGVGAPAARVFALGFAFGAPGPFDPPPRGVFDFVRPMHRSRCPSSVHRTVSDAQ
ncbi:MAG: hypothetical protein ACKVU4_00025 [Phycisphaerales bacterium]